MVLRFDDGVRHDVFFGVLPPDAAKALLVQLTGWLRHDRIMSREPVDPYRWHITLNLLGQFFDQIPSRLIPDALAVAGALKTPPFDVTFDYVIGTPSGLLLKSSDGSPPLKESRRILVEALIRAGLRQYIQQRFNPHLTLSYAPNDAPRMSIKPITWRVPDFVLIESLFGRHKHIELGRWSI